MPKPSKKNPSVPALLADPNTPLDQRLMFLKMLAADPGPEAQSTLSAVLTSLSATTAQDLYSEKTRELAAVIEQIQEGPLRNAAFVELVQTNGGPPQACVIVDDGSIAYSAVPDPEMARTLRRGDRVLLDGRGRALLHKAPGVLKIGEEAQLERAIDERHVEVSLRGQDRFVFLASQDLADQIAAGSLEPGSTLIVSAKQAIAFAALPPRDGLSHYRYLVKEGPPDVVIERDIGAPPKFIAELAELVRLEMTQPDLRRRYRLRRCVMTLLSGVSGSGKTLAIHALWRRIYEVVSEVTGVPVDQLPPRVFRLRLPEVLSMWLGESDKNLDRFFAEVEQMAEQKFVTPDGREFILPCLVWIEELDGLARSRGSGDPVFDRILTTALQRLDSTRHELQGKLILFVGTTNEAGLVDRSFLRRIGGTVVQYGRLDKRSFVKVLEKHVTGMPLASNNGCTPAQLFKQLVNGVTTWLFSRNGSDPALLELTYAGSTTPQPFYRRDFLTGAIIDRAVQQAAQNAVEAERAGQPPGMHLEMLVRAFDEQLRSVADQVTPHTAGHFVNLPDGVRVATCRRLPQPALSPIEIQRH